MSSYEPPMMIRIEFDHMKHSIINAITGEHMKEQLDVAVEKAISEIDFDGMISRILHDELNRTISRAIADAVRANQELANRCGEAVRHKLNAVLER